MGQFETEVLAIADNRVALAELAGQWIDRVHAAAPLKWITLDMDSSVSPTHRAQEGTAWNCHFGCMRYHPLFVFNQFGHMRMLSGKQGDIQMAETHQERLWRGFPKTLLEFDERFGTEEACRKYLAACRWNGRPRCGRCNSEHV